MSATFAAAIDASYRGADDAYPKLSERINRLEARDARLAEIAEKRHDGSKAVRRKGMGNHHHTYIFAGVGAVILGGLAYASLGGVPNTIAVCALLLKIAVPFHGS